MMTHRRIGRHSLLLLAGLAAACSADSPTISDVNPLVTAQVNGTAWEANYQQDVAIADLSQQGRVLEVVGLQANADLSTQQISIVIPNYAGPGTYPLGAPNPAAGAFGIYVTRASQTAEPVVYFTTAETPGTITVAEMNDGRRWVSGTFSFRAQEADGTAVVEVAGGEFQGRFVVQ